MRWMGATLALLGACFALTSAMVATCTRLDVLILCASSRGSLWRLTHADIASKPPIRPAATTIDNLKPATSLSGFATTATRLPFGKNTVRRRPRVGESQRSDPTQKPGIPLLSASSGNLAAARA